MDALSKLFSLFKSSNTITSQTSLKISENLKTFVKDEMLPGLNITPDYFWTSFENIYNKFSQRNKDLLIKRQLLQDQIDKWHIENKHSEFDLDKYKKFLNEIGYLQPRSKNFSISTSNVDPEIRKIAGPQLVVPVMNARFALNAANARWGSLYDALYGTDMIPEDNDASRAGAYNPKR